MWKYFPKRNLSKSRKQENYAFEFFCNNTMHNNPTIIEIMLTNTNFVPVPFLVNENLLNFFYGFCFRSREERKWSTTKHNLTLLVQPTNYGWGVLLLMAAVVNVSPNRRGTATQTNLVLIFGAKSAQFLYRYWSVSTTSSKEKGGLLCSTLTIRLLFLLCIGWTITRIYGVKVNLKIQGA